MCAYSRPLAERPRRRAGDAARPVPRRARSPPVRSHLAALQARALIDTGRLRRGRLRSRRVRPTAGRRRRRAAAPALRRVAAAGGRLLDRVRGRGGDGAGRRRPGHPIAAAAGVDRRDRPAHRHRTRSARATSPTRRRSGPRPTRLGLAGLAHRRPRGARAVQPPGADRRRRHRRGRDRRAQPVRWCAARRPGDGDRADPARRRPPTRSGRATPAGRSAHATNGPCLQHNLLCVLERAPMTSRCAVVGIGQTHHAAARRDVTMGGLVREAAERAMARRRRSTGREIDAVVLGKAPDVLEGVMSPELLLADALRRRRQAGLPRVHVGQRRRCRRRASASASSARASAHACSSWASRSSPRARRPARRCSTSPSRRAGRAAPAACSPPSATSTSTARARRHTSATSPRSRTARTRCATRSPRSAGPTSPSR